MKSIKGTETEKNLLKAFAGESQAKNRYTFFAKIAKKEGYEKIAFFFEETATNESAHAKEFFKRLEGGMVEITASYPAGILSTTLVNLNEAANGEEEEGEVLYPEFAEIARSEGFPEIADLFAGISEIEIHHMERYRALAAKLESGEMFKKDVETDWRCRNCGYIHSDKEAIELCPVCKHPRAHFEISSDVF